MIQIRRKELLSLIAIIFLEVVFSTHILSSLYQKLAIEDLKKNSEIISYLAKNFPSEDYKKVFENIDLRFTIISINGDVLYDSRNTQLFFLKCIQILFFIILNIFIKFFYTNYLKRDLEKKISIMKDFLESNEERKNLQLHDEKWLSQFWIILKEWQNKNLDNIDRIEKEKKILKSLLESLPFFIALFDSKGNIIIKNNTFSSLIPEKAKNYLEAFPTIEIIDILKTSFINKKKFSEIMYLKESEIYWALELKYLDFDDVFLIVIQDITEKKRKRAKSKKFFK
ncbi:MAG: hypothetical protein SOY60_04465 [Fusobacterium gastrosuis]|uniref:hypothetical protein n=1 Tax=Fusobacterium gastrosuis TaxID=1755100 RepID=UPI002A843CAC|nr:hypothetical protein [Fusobacterium gastrosuis]